MPNLSDADREAVWKEFMSEVSAKNETFSQPLTKADVRAAINGMDQWLTDNASSGNQAIPQPARSGLTSGQKARMQSLIVLKRWGTGV